ncbi:MAG: electron transfer flavoprotein subunit alpha [Desulfitibacter sp. BRH_c19]|nr:MAG: electron transfer flavoprotein subunit alpha [Desulfitibacter sp. BRH_c19]
MTVRVIEKNCIACGLCVQACPFEALEVKGDVAVVDPDKCTNCGDCVEICPADALALDEPPKEMTKKEIKSVEDNEAAAKEIKKELKEYNGIWIFIEQMDGKPAPVSWELLGEGARLAKQIDTELVGVLIGDKVASLAGEAFSYGADKVYLVENPLLKNYVTEPYTKVLVNLCKKYKPEIFLFGATSLGRDIAGAVATQLQTGLTADCTELTVDESSRYLMQTRPAFGGNIMATIVCRHRRPQMATVRPRVMSMPERQDGRTGEIIREDMDLKQEEILTRIIEVIEEKGSAVYLDKAEIIVAAGRGIGSKTNLKVIEELSEVLGGTVAASRAAVEAGWFEHTYQVGQTGVTVRPKVYFAVGISGAIQHLVGMQTSDVIVAINNDPDAPIFKFATFGIVGDYATVVPALTGEFKKRLNEEGLR